MEFTCTGFNCYDCPFDDCIRPDAMNDGEKVVLREKRGYKRPVYQLKRNGERVARYDSPYAASLKTGIDHAAIYYCLQGKRKSAKGYLWTYA